MSRKANSMDFGWFTVPPAEGKTGNSDKNNSTSKMENSGNHNMYSHPEGPDPPKATDYLNPLSNGKEDVSQEDVDRACDRMNDSDYQEAQPSANYDESIVMDWPLSGVGIEQVERNTTKPNERKTPCPRPVSRAVRDIPPTPMPPLHWQGNGPARPTYASWRESWHKSNLRNRGNNNNSNNTNDVDINGNTTINANINHNGDNNNNNHNNNSNINNDNNNEYYYHDINSNDSSNHDNVIDCILCDSDIDFRAALLSAALEQSMTLRLQEMGTDTISLSSSTDPPSQDRTTPNKVLRRTKKSQLSLSSNQNAHEKMTKVEKLKQCDKQSLGFGAKIKKWIVGWHGWRKFSCNQTNYKYDKLDEEQKI